VVVFPFDPVGDGGKSHLTLISYMGGQRQESLMSVINRKNHFVFQTGQFTQPRSIDHCAGGALRKCRLDIIMAIFILTVDSKK
jgi:hypothetical protein